MLLPSLPLFRLRLGMPWMQMARGVLESSLRPGARRACVFGEGKGEGTCEVSLPGLSPLVMLVSFLPRSFDASHSPCPRGKNIQVDVIAKALPGRVLAFRAIGYRVAARSALHLYSFLFQRL